MLISLQTTVSCVFENVYFESDGLMIVNAITNVTSYENELVTIISQYRDSFQGNTIFYLGNNNRFVHIFARASIFESRPSLYYIPPISISSLILNEIE